MKPLTTFLLWISITAALAQAPTDDLQKKRDQSLQKVLNRAVEGKKVFGAVFAIKMDTLNWRGSAGNLSINQPYFIASTTKLFVTTLILQLKEKGKLRLDDRIGVYLPADIMNGLHVYKGKSYAEELTIKHLLAHTSGLPDYFQDKGVSGMSLEKEIASGRDQYWTFEDAIKRTKSMKPLFAPGTKGKAHYSDANYQLLGKIIEQITGKSFGENCTEFILNPLGLTQTYLYRDTADHLPMPLYYKRKKLHIPQAMASFGADGGMVSTASDMLVFAEAFFGGKLFSPENIPALQQWNKIFYPMQSGVGIHLFKLPRMFNPTGIIPYFIGHSGLSGALVFYSPEKNLFISGTVNQVAYPDQSFKTMVKLTQILLRTVK